MILKSLQTEAGGYGLRFKFIALISLLFILTGSLLSLFFFNSTKGTLEDELKRRGLSLAKNLAYNSIYGVSVEDTGILQRLTLGIAEEADVTYVIIMDSQGKVLVHSDPEKLGQVLTDPLNQTAIKADNPRIEKSRTSNGQTVYDISAPVFSQLLIGVAETDTASASGKIGTVRIGLSSKGLKEKLTTTLKLGILMTVVVIGLGIGLSTFLVRLIVTPLERIAYAAVKIADGDFTQKVDVPLKDEVGVLAHTFSRMSGNLGGMIRKLQTVASNVTMASLKISTSTKRVFEGAQIQAASTEKTSSSVEEMNTSAKEIAESVDILSDSAEETSSSILEMSSSISEVANSTAGLASSVEETASSIMEMSASIRQVTENVEILSTAADETATAISQVNNAIREVETHAKEAATLSGNVSRNAQELGMRSIEKTIQGMHKIQETVVKSAEVINRLSRRSEQIGEILSVIDEVTKQTNLLALNAAILAAQAGEQGKGFSVVADEIKNLADRTATSTKEIGQLITNVQTEAKDAVEAIKEGAKSVKEGMTLSLEAGEALKKILESADQSTQMAKNIERATVEQAKGVKQVTEAVQQVNTMAQQIAKAMQEQTHTGEQILVASEKMRDMTHHVKMSTEEQAKGSRQITKAVENVTERVQQILRAVNEQRRGTEVIAKSIEEIRHIASENTRFVEEMNQAVETLTQQVTLLKGEVDNFKV
jgi:methyl-accepting chemotaxis protein